MTYKTRQAMYVKRNIVARSHDDLYIGNGTVLYFILLRHARPCQQKNTYLTICVLFIVALRTSLPVKEIHLSLHVKSVIL